MEWMQSFRSRTIAAPTSGMIDSRTVSGPLTSSYQEIFLRNFQIWEIFAAFHMFFCGPTWEPSINWAKLDPQTETKASLVSQEGATEVQSLRFCAQISQKQNINELQSSSEEKYRTTKGKKENRKMHTLMQWRASKSKWTRDARSNSPREEEEENGVEENGVDARAIYRRAGRRNLWRIQWRLHILLRDIC